MISELVLRGALDELVSLKVVRKDYGVVINSVAMEIDWKSTGQLRYVESNI